MDHLTKVIKKNVFQPFFPNTDVYFTYLHNVQKYSEEKHWSEWTVKWFYDCFCLFGAWQPQSPFTCIVCKRSLDTLFKVSKKSV